VFEVRQTHQVVVTSWTISIAVEPHPRTGIFRHFEYISPEDLARVEDVPASAPSAGA
jgi:hypothetical protein